MVHNSGLPDARQRRTREVGKRRLSRQLSHLCHRHREQVIETGAAQRRQVSDGASEPSRVSVPCRSVPGATVLKTVPYFRTLA